MGLEGLTGGVERLWLPPASLATMTGTPASAALSSTAHYLLFDAAAIEASAGSFIPPAHWASTHVDLYWVNAVAAAGDVVWRLDWKSAGDGELVTGPTAAPQVTAAAPEATGTVEVTRIGSAIAYTPGEYGLVKIQRRATDAADTLANDAGVLGILLSRAA